jgi:acetyltransferase-like isoleucine patch superfamily enzyme
MPFTKKISKYKFEIKSKWHLLMFSLFEKPLFKSFGSLVFIGKDFFFFNKQYISIGQNFSALDRIRIEAIEKYQNQKFSPEIIIGNNVGFNSDIHIGCINKIDIGNNVLLASRIYISDHSHGEVNVDALKLPPNERNLISKGAVIIEDNVWIGEGACILPNVTIGKNSIIGANAVVTKSFPANSVIAGIPAKLIKTLS